MLSKCANPACTATFRYLREGTIYVADWIGGNAVNQQGSACWQRNEMFWLCGQCSKQLILKKKDGSIVPESKGMIPDSGGSALREVRIYN